MIRKQTKDSTTTHPPIYSPKTAHLSMSFLPELTPIQVIAIVTSVALFLSQTAWGQKVTFLLQEATECALEMAEGYNEQYRMNGDETSDHPPAAKGKANIKGA